MRFFRHLIFTIGVRIITITCSLFISIIISRYLGPSGKGIHTSITTLSNIAIQFFSIGLFSATVYYVSKDSNLSPKVTANTIWVSIIGGSFATFICLVIANKSNIITADHNSINFTYISIGMTVIPFTFAITSFQSIFLGLQDYRTYNQVELLLRGGTLIAVGVAILILSVNLAGVFIAIFAATILSTVYCLYMLNKKGILRLRPDYQLQQKMLRYGLKAYMANVLALLVIRSDIFIINTMLGSDSTGIYSVSVQFIDLLAIIPNVIATLYFPKVSSTTQQGKITQQVIRMAVPMMLVIYSLAGVFAQYIIPFAFGEDFSGSVVPFLLLLPGAFALSLETIIAQDVASRNYPLTAVLMWIPVCIINIVLTTLLLPRIGINGASIASSTAYIVAFILMVKIFKNKSSCSMQDIFLLKRSDIALLNKQFRNLLQNVRQESV